jgi:phosphotransferase system  glucose/maltose/N-acetylglucosamine-specific IIC component
MKRAFTRLLPVLAVLFSLGGIVGFYLLFLRDLNVYWLIVAPVIFAVYQIPAAVVWWLWKKKRKAERGENEEEDEGPGTPSAS